MAIEHVCEILVLCIRVKLLRFAHSLVFSVGQDGAALFVICRADTHVCHLCFCLAAALISFTCSPEDKN
jgi:hypothetical protein